MSKAIEHILKGSIAVENCFLAAGVTITAVTVAQSVGIALSWVR
jgi:hypothetical protein